MGLENQDEVLNVAYGTGRNVLPCDALLRFLQPSAAGLGVGISL